MKPASGLHMLANIGWALLMLCSGILLAWLIMVFPPKLVFLLLGGVAGLGLLALSIESLLLVTLLVTFLLVGPVEYFFGMRIVWLSYLLVMLLALKSLLFRVVQFRQPDSVRSRLSAGIIPLLLLMVSILFLGTILNKPANSLLTIEVRDHLVMWLLLLPFLFGQISSGACIRIWKVLIPIAMLQSPFVILQYLVYARARSDATWWDAIVGTFVGDPATGGDSGGLALFVVMMATLLMGLWKEKAITGRKLVLCLPIVLASLFLSEVKVSFVLLPLAAFLLFRHELIRKPLHGLLMISFSVAFVAVLNLTYQAVFDTDKATDVNSGISFALDEGAIRANGEMGRMASLIYWVRHGGDFTGVHATFIGNGLGASNSSNPLDLGFIAKRVFPLHIDATGMVKLLWDGGLLGAACFVSVFLLAARAARLNSECGDQSPAYRGIQAGISASLFLALVHLFYTKSVAGQMPQIYMVVILMIACSLSVPKPYKVA